VQNGPRARAALELLLLQVGGARARAGEPHKVFPALDLLGAAGIQVLPAVSGREGAGLQGAEDRAADCTVA